MRPFRIGFIAFFLAMLWFIPLGMRDLAHADEGKYAQIAREMWLSGDWITPRLNSLAYFENPPLQYWATAIFYHLFGPSEWSARFWPALTGFAGLLLSWWLGKRFVSAGVGVLAALIQSATLGYAGLAHVSTLDMSLCFFLQLAVSGYLVHVQKTDKNPVLSTAMIGAGMAGAALTHGLIGVVLPAILFVADSLWHKDSRFWKKPVQIRIAGIALLLGLPWFIAVKIAHPDLPENFFVNAYGIHSAKPEPRGDSSGYFFISMLLAGLMPWTLLWLRSLKDWKNNLQSRPVKDKFIRFQRIWIIWTLLIFIFFICIKSTQISYILPVFPALSWLLAFSLYNNPLRIWRLPAIISLIICLAGIMALPLIAGKIADAWTRELFEAYQPYLLASILLVASGFAWLLWQEKREKTVLNLFKINTWIPIVIVWSIALQIAFQGYQVFSPQYSMRPLIDSVVKKHGVFKEKIPFYSVDIEIPTLLFYLKRMTISVGSQMPLQSPSFKRIEGGCERNSAWCIPDSESWQKKWLSEPVNAYAIMDVSRYKQFRQANLPMRVIGENRRYVIVTRF